MYMNASPEVKYRIIRDTVTKDDNQLNINELCKTAGVSRSGYYYWVNSEPTRQAKELQDRKDFDLILVAFQYRGYNKGVRGICMRLLHLDPPVVMNIKKIRRLMRKFNLRCPIRKANPYRILARAKQESRIAPNVLNREFRSHGPRSILLTDITYIPRYSHHKDPVARFTYVSIIMDAFTKEVLACVCSPSLSADFVLETVSLLMEQHGDELKTNTLIHSDQGCQYTSSRFTTILNDVGLRQSMSRRGNCWDNAPQESLFGHMKDEIRVLPSDSNQNITEKVLEWIDYYNNERYQWSLAKLSPSEYYRYVTTGVYPLPGAPPEVKLEDRGFGSVSEDGFFMEPLIQIDDDNA
ncbi:MAG: IS3 family transposase [Sphaerochaetaceae bacterium]|jgi:putative transposase|nr:IS3 family transposase [Sphaerochaeta sp.]